jgi:hypothetical protein
MKKTRMNKQRWGRHTLPAGFAKCKYPSDSNYHMTKKNTMDRRNPNLGYQTTSKLSKYWGLQSNNYAKLAATPRRRNTVLVEQITQRIHRKLE